MDNELSSSAMQRLLGIGKVALNELAKQGVAVRGVAPSLEGPLKPPPRAN